MVTSFSGRVSHSSVGRTTLSLLVSGKPSTLASCMPAVELGRARSSTCFGRIKAPHRAAFTARARRGSALLRELEEARKEGEDRTEQVPTVTKLEWDSPLGIIRYPDPRLRAVNAKIGVFDESLKQLSLDLLETMYKGDDGVGLAAPQVGVNVRLMVFNPTGQPGETEYVFVNPKIVSSGTKVETTEEGCLSFPRIFADVERPTQVKVKAQDLKGNSIVVNLKNWQARIFQHEYDHLQGVLFHDRMKTDALAKIKPKLIDLEARFRDQHPDTHIQTISR